MSRIKRITPIGEAYFPAIQKPDTQFDSKGIYQIKVLFDKLYSNELEISEQKNRDCMITVSEYYYRNNIVIDKEINFYTCLIELSRQIL